MYTFKYKSVHNQFRLLISAFNSFHLLAKMLTHFISLYRPTQSNLFLQQRQVFLPDGSLLDTSLEFGTILRLRKGAYKSLEWKRNLMAHREAREEKWRGKRRMEWVASSLPLYRNAVYPALLPLMRTPRLPAADWTDTPADRNGVVRFAGRPNLVSARVPSHSVFTLPLYSSEPSPPGHFPISPSNGSQLFC